MKKISTMEEAVIRLANSVKELTTRVILLEEALIPRPRAIEPDDDSEPDTGDE